MLPIVWSLSVLWFSHARVAPPSPPPISPAAQLTFTMRRPQDLSDSVAERMVCEAVSIWRPLGVELLEQSGGDGTPSAVRVIVEDREMPVGAGLLGWVRFIDDLGPEPVIHVSRPAVLRFLEATERGQHLSPASRNVLLARMLGRVLAHELGHYLLQSPGHTVHGLMRASWSIEALTAVEPAGFDVTLADVSELQAELSRSGFRRST